MAFNEKKTGSFDDELNARNIELEKQRKERQNRSVEMTLNAIFERVQSRQADIQVFISNMKRPEKALRGLLWNEIKYAADGNLLCTVYRERRKSEQRVIAYTGCCWRNVACRRLTAKTPISWRRRGGTRHSLFLSLENIKFLMARYGLTYRTARW